MDALGNRRISPYRSLRNAIASSNAGQSTAPELTMSVNLGRAQDIHIDPKRLLRTVRESDGRIEGGIFFCVIQDGKKAPRWQHGSCYVNAENGSLRHVTHKGSDSNQTDSENQGSETFITLIDDLRKCKIDIVSSPVTKHQQIKIEPTTASAEREKKRLATTFLLPGSNSQFEAWFAVLKGWQMTQLEDLLASDIVIDQVRLTTEPENWAVGRASENAPATIIQATLQLIDPSLSAQMHHQGNPAECVLQDDGALSITNKATGVRMDLQLKGLPASAIQHLDPSVTGAELAIAVYPSFARSDDVSTHLQPFALSFIKKSNFELWMNLLKKHAQIELYQREGSIAPSTGTSGKALEPGNIDMTSPFRVCSSMEITGIKARFGEEAIKSLKRILAESDPANPTKDRIECRIDVMVDNHVFARTPFITINSPAYMTWPDTINIKEVPASATSVRLRLVGRRTKVTASQKDGPAIKRQEVTLCEAHVLWNASIARIEGSEKSSSHTYQGTAKESFVIESGRETGQLSLYYQWHNSILFPVEALEMMSDSLETFSLPNALYKLVPNDRAKPLSLLFLDYYQGHGDATFWIGDLLKKEMDLRSTKSSFQSKSNPSDTPNTLFRDNNLATRVMDEYMKRLGQEYLENTIGVLIRQIVDDDTHCEIEGGGVGQKDRTDAMEYIKLKAYLVWDAIRSSSFRCPAELRSIFKYARTAAKQAFGRNSPQVNSCITAFLFLRFFCPAIMSPHLWQLTPTAPKPHVHRTLLTISKTINAISNLTDFGTKQPHLAPLNDVINTAHPTLRQYLDNLCAIPATELPMDSDPHVPGVPMLPGLVDPSRALWDLAGWFSEAGTFEDVEVRRWYEACHMLRSRGPYLLAACARERVTVKLGGVLWRGFAEKLEREEGGFWGKMEVEEVVEERGKGKGKGKEEKGKKEGKPQDEFLRMQRTMGFL